MKLFITILLSILYNCDVAAQGCSTLGQTPSTAFPVCGTTTFKQANVPVCRNQKITVNGCDNTTAEYGDKNPFWYKFTCYKSGTLGFLITPNDLGDDYDWQIFDITGHDPNDVYFGTSLFVVANWSGSYGLTGTSSNAASILECASRPEDNVPTYSAMPELIEGHTYLLLVSHYTDSQSGYSLSFTGGTASITDPKQPAMLKAKADCIDTKAIIYLNKSLKCSSLAANGSDFSINTTAVKIISASSPACSEGFDMDSLILTFDKPLQEGNYTITAKKGTDANTLLDNCDNPVAVGSTVDLVYVKHSVSASFTYKISYGCKQDTIECMHDGNNGINKWTWTFDNGLRRTTQNTQMIYTTFGSKKIFLTVSNNFCSDTASADVLLDNELKAAFEVPSLLCPEDLAVLKNNSVGKITNWFWNFGDGTSSDLQSPPDHKYQPNSEDGYYTIQLITKDDHNCIDTAAQKIKVLNNCYIAVPGAFTPNGDGLNDYLYPLNAYKALNLEFKVYNRYGQLVFQTKDWTNKWDGILNGVAQPSGTYVWTLTYIHSDTGKKYVLKGTTVLIR